MLTISIRAVYENDFLNLFFPLIITNILMYILKINSGNEYCIFTSLGNFFKHKYFTRCVKKIHVDITIVFELWHLK